MTKSENRPLSNKDTFVCLLIYVIFFLSGAAALVYEISWSRQIGLLFGHTINAASIVLASYFAGMAIGYWAGSKWCTRISPLLGYAIAEIVVAAWAFAIPMLLWLSETTMFAPWLSSSSIALQSTSRALFGFLLLLPATIALGVTLPMIAEHFARTSIGDEIGNSKAARLRRITFAYSLNTAGALAGVLAATFYGLLYIGVTASSFVAAGVSVVCALAAIFVSLIETPDAPVADLSHEFSAQRSSQAQQASHSTDWLSWPWLLALSFMSGFGTLALQVLFTRMFSLVFHNSTYTFGIVIAVFLGSLSLGSGLASLLQRWFAARRLIGVATGLGAMFTVTAPLIFAGTTELNYFESGGSFVEYMSGAVGLVTLAIAPAIICLGMLLPLTWALVDQDKTQVSKRERDRVRTSRDVFQGGRVVGLLTAVNTLAAAIGALFASLVLLTMIGLWESVVVISGAFFVASLGLMWQSRQRVIAVGLGIVIAVAAVMVARNPIDTEYGRIELNEQLIRRWNSAYGWIDLIQHEPTGAYKIRQNLHYRFGKTGNNVREYRQAHLPLLLHPNPRDVLFMGLGTGLTAGGAIPHPEVKSIGAVELIPEVVEAIRELADFNRNVIDHEKVTVHVDDARHHLLANSQYYDVIVSDLFVPWESQSGYLYTVEHYDVAISRLKPGGVFCQWLPLYQVGEREFELIANSFGTVFPQTTLWWGQTDSVSPMIALVGSRMPLEIDVDQLSARIAVLSEAFESSDPKIATPIRFWGHYLGDWVVQAGQSLNTDEHPRVEFLAPISNRDGMMLRGDRLRDYYDRVFSQLPAAAATLIPSRKNSDAVYPSTNQRKHRQRMILFGS
ncbi:MAG: spermidine synthase [Mariniblastus sp.]